MGKVMYNKRTGMWVLARDVVPETQDVVGGVENHGGETSEESTFSGVVVPRQAPGEKWIVSEQGVRVSKRPSKGWDEGELNNLSAEDRELLRRLV